jgi:hypothetical protein
MDERFVQQSTCSRCSMLMHAVACCVDTVMPCLMSASTAKRYSGNQAPGKCQSGQSGPTEVLTSCLSCSTHVLCHCQALLWLRPTGHVLASSQPKPAVLANHLSSGMSSCLVGLRYSYRRLSPGICCAHVLDTLPQLLGGVDQSRVTAVSSAINDATFPARHERSC